jgi:hypothetical protein
MATALALRVWPSNGFQRAATYRGYPLGYAALVYHCVGAGTVLI